MRIKKILSSLLENNEFEMADCELIASEHFWNCCLCIFLLLAVYLILTIRMFQARLCSLELHPFFQIYNVEIINSLLHSSWGKKIYVLVALNLRTDKEVEGVGN